MRRLAPLRKPARGDAKRLAPLRKPIRVCRDAAHASAAAYSAAAYTVATAYDVVAAAAAAAAHAAAADAFMQLNPGGVQRQAPKAAPLHAHGSNTLWWQAVLAVVVKEVMVLRKRRLPRSCCCRPPRRLSEHGHPDQHDAEPSHERRRHGAAAKRSEAMPGSEVHRGWHGGSFGVSLRATRCARHRPHRPRRRRRAPAHGDEQPASARRRRRVGERAHLPRVASRWFHLQQSENREPQNIPQRIG